jgi:hypothetical protein
MVKEETGMKTTLPHISCGQINVGDGYREIARPLVIYHAACRDGFAAAWAAKFIMPNAEVFEGFYGQEPPDVTGRDVFLVDFTYRHNVMLVLAQQAKSLTILDHHKTAQADLGDDFAKTVQLYGLTTPVIVHFDMARSGAGIAWDVLVAKDPCWSNGDGCSAGGGHIGEGAYAREGEFGCQYARPWAIDYVEDRDLWTWKLPHSRIVNAYLGALPFDFPAWEATIRQPLSEAIAAGNAIQMKVRQYAAEVGKNARRVDFGEIAGVPFVNAPQCDISELLEHLMDATGREFVMGWWQRADGLFQYSLRSRGEFDVSALAKAHGGGGHKNAAGFQLAERLPL